MTRSDSKLRSHPQSLKFLTCDPLDGAFEVFPPGGSQTEIVYIRCFVSKILLLRSFLLTESKFARSCALVYMLNFNWLDLIRNRLGTEMVILGFLVSTSSSSSSLQSASDLGTSTNRSKTDLETWMGW